MIAGNNENLCMGEETTQYRLYLLGLPPSRHRAVYKRRRACKLLRSSAARLRSPRTGQVGRRPGHGART